MRLKTIRLDLSLLLAVIFICCTGSLAHAQDDGESGAQQEGTIEAEEAPSQEQLARTSTVINGGAEVEAPFKKFYNWRMKALDPSKFATAPCTRKTQDDFGSSQLSFGGASPPAINEIVLHETGETCGFTRTDAGVHFLVERDGTIVQLADLNARFKHASNHDINKKSIGIEISNNPSGTWGAKLDTTNHMQAKTGLLGSSAVNIPPAVQLEAVYELLKFLTETDWSKVIVVGEQYSVVQVPRQWLNFLMTGYFLSITNGYRINRARPEGWVEKPGIISHSIIFEHGDGFGPALYAWLRFEQGMSHVMAENATKDLLECEPIKLGAKHSWVTATPPIFGDDYEVKWVNKKKVTTTKLIPVYSSMRFTDLKACAAARGSGARLVFPEEEQELVVE